MKPPKSLMSLLAACALVACGPQQAPEASFVATLGSDTLVVEQFRMHPEKVEAEILIRTPRTLLFKQTLLLNADGKFMEFHSDTFDPGQNGNEPIEQQHAVVVDDSVVVTQVGNGEPIRASFAREDFLLPWIDMVHWPYEVATRQMAAAGESARDQQMFTLRGPAPYEIRSLGEDSVSIKHPFRGTMYARTDAHGALLYYDATSTTRKLVVQRAGKVDMQALATRYASRPVGALSGEGESESNIHGAVLSFTFGQPAKRGRKLFGGIVPWGERWRTGANRATHFTTDTDLLFGDLQVPTGTYTLFTIPEPEGGTLIINRQTGQNGNTYDPNQDLGRVPMAQVRLEHPMELFTIDARERDGGGVIRLMWGDTAFEIPFQVAGAGSM